MKILDFHKWLVLKNTSPMAIKRRPSMSFTIANNLLTPSTKATDLGIFP
jgi:hypothetical protein